MGDRHVEVQTWEGLGARSEVAQLSPVCGVVTRLSTSRFSRLHYVLEDVPAAKEGEVSSVACELFYGHAGAHSWASVDPYTGTALDEEAAHV